MCYNQIVERTHSPIDEKTRIPTIGKREGKEGERYGRIDCAVCDCI